MNDIVLAVLLCVCLVGLFIAGYATGEMASARRWLALAHENQIRRWLKTVTKQEEKR